MTTFNDSESGASVRTKINAAITTVDGLGSGDNLLMTAAQSSKLAGIEAGAEVNAVDSVAGETGAITAGALRTALNVEDGADVTDATNVAAAGAVMDGDFSSNGVMTRTGAGAYAVKALSGADAAVVTGTAGTTDQIAVWNADGDLVGATAGTIAGLTEKATPATGDWLVLSDSAASGTLKKVNWSSLPSGGGTVDTSGTPVANDFARFTDADTIEGRSYSEVRADLGLVIGTNVQAYDANLPTWPSTVNATEVGYLDGVTSAIQTQLNGKLADVVDDTTPTLGGDLDGAGNEVANYTNSVVTSVSGTLTTAAHAGNVIVTSGNVTVPTTAGFTCIIIAGGAHTVTFNSTTSAAMAAGDIMTVAVQSGTVIHAVLTAAADKVTFT